MALSLAAGSAPRDHRLCAWCATVFICAAAVLLLDRRPFFYPMLVLATLASVVASQALITGCFSIISNVCDDKSTSKRRALVNQHGHTRINPHNKSSGRVALHTRILHPNAAPASPSSATALTCSLRCGAPSRRPPLRVRKLLLHYCAWLQLHFFLVQSSMQPHHTLTTHPTHHAPAAHRPSSWAPSPSCLCCTPRSTCAARCMWRRSTGP